MFLWMGFHPSPTSLSTSKPSDIKTVSTTPVPLTRTISLSSLKSEHPAIQEAFPSSGKAATQARFPSALFAPKYLISLCSTRNLTLLAGISSSGQMVMPAGSWSCSLAGLSKALIFGADVQPASRNTVASVAVGMWWCFIALPPQAYGPASLQFTSGGEGWRRLRDMSRFGGARQVWCSCTFLAAAVAVGAGLTSCEYQDGFSEPSRGATAVSRVPQVPATKPSHVLELEQGNRAKLDEVLGVPTRDAYLDVTEMISGRMNSFVVNGQVPADGSYDITIACIGTSKARMVLDQSTPGASPFNHSFDFTCGTPNVRTVELRSGGMTVDVMNGEVDESEWGTGAFASVRITAAIQ